MGNDTKLERGVGFCIMITLVFTLFMLGSTFTVLPISFFIFSENQGEIAITIIFFISLFGALLTALISKIKKRLD